MNSSPHAQGQEEQSPARSDLKAQRDLLALKVLADPHFLERVPSLKPAQPLSRGAGHLEASPEADQALKALSDEVQMRVYEEIERLLPDLIASTLSEVMNEWSRSDATPSGGQASGH